MNQRQSRNQWNGGIATHPASNKSECTNQVENFSPWFFWNQEGILRIDYLPKGQTINAEYYSFLLVQWKDILKEKRRGNFTNGVLFLHDNAQPRRTLAAHKKLAYLASQCLDHPPYSPDLAQLHYHLLPGLEKHWKVAIFHPARRSLLPRRSDSTFWILKGCLKNKQSRSIQTAWQISELYAPHSIMTRLFGNMPDGLWDRHPADPQEW